MMKRIGISIGVIIVLVVVSLLWYGHAHAPLPAGSERITLVAPDGGKRIRMVAEIADNDASRERGLMSRTSLPAEHGMLFVFDHAQPLMFWMKNTLIPLDILFFDANGSLVSRTTMEPCTKNPCTLYSSAKDAMYALEVNQAEPLVSSVTTEWKLSRD